MPSRPRPQLALLLCLPLLAGTLALGAGTASGADSPVDDPAKGLRYQGLERANGVGPCQGKFEIRAAAGRGGPARCTHGPDAAPAGVDVRVARGPESPAETGLRPEPVAREAAPVCVGDGSSGPRVQLLYANITGRADRFATFADSFQTWAAAMDAVFDASAAETGGSRRVRFLHDAACKPVVGRLTLSQAAANDFQVTVDELSAKGFNRNDRKYLVWVDANVYCGIGEVYRDDRAGQNNHNNVYGLISRVDNGCWGVVGQSVEAHELMHNLGGVQETAPNATRYNHCTDDRDRMCYSDGSGEPMEQVCPASHENVFDCNHDDYFSTAAPAGSYLATHWNAANSAWLTAPTPATVPGARFNPLPPARVLDTRLGEGAPVAKIGQAASIDLHVTGRGGVPASGVSAVVLNVTVTEPEASGYLTAWPTGEARPLASNLNFVPGQTVPNLVVVKVGAGGQVSLFNSAGASHVVADVSGWYGASGAAAGSRYHPVVPSRLLDTRTGLGAVLAMLPPVGTLDLQVTGRGGVPATGVTAVALNVAVTEPLVGGYLTAWPDGDALPLASSLNFAAGQTVANHVVVKVGGDGRISFFNGGGRLHIVADVSGWFGPDGETTGARYHPLTPARMLDTRTATGAPAAPVASGATLDLQVTGRGGVPATGVSAVILNVAVVDPDAAGYLTGWPAGEPMPLASSLNFAAGQTVPNLVVAKLGAGGKVSLFNGGGTAHIVADVAGWYGGG